MPELIPARGSAAARLTKGQHLKVINTPGTQVVDFWAFHAADPKEFMSMEHARQVMGRIRPQVGDALATNRRRPILTLVEDTSPGIHDTMIAACDIYRYMALGCTGYHESCTDNLFSAVRGIGFEVDECPSPLNLWMNIPVDAKGEIDWLPPVSKPGDHVLFRAELDCVAVMSACPQDMVPINGADLTPKEAHYEVV